MFAFGSHLLGTLFNVVRYYHCHIIMIIIIIIYYYNHPTTE
jgi:hypothetical protein